MHCLIIDEKSMMRLDMPFWIEQRCGEQFAHSRDQCFGQLSAVLVRDFFHLTPVLQKPLF